MFVIQYSILADWKTPETDPELDLWVRKEIIYPGTTSAYNGCAIHWSSMRTNYIYALYRSYDLKNWYYADIMGDSYYTWVVSTDGMSLGHPHKNTKLITQITFDPALMRGDSMCIYRHVRFEYSK